MQEKVKFHKKTNNQKHQVFVIFLKEEINLFKNFQDYKFQIFNKRKTYQVGGGFKDWKYEQTKLHNINK